MPESPALTFDEICEKEPLVASLKRDCIAESDRARLSPNSYCSDPFWHGYSDESGGIRGRLERILGPARADPEPPELCSDSAYKIAHDSLYALLPACTHSPGAHPPPV
jgi:hypothetical protein